MTHTETTEDAQKNTPIIHKTYTRHTSDTPMIHAIHTKNTDMTHT